MSRTYRNKLPYLPEDNEWNVINSEGYYRGKYVTSRPDIDNEEVAGLYIKRKAKGEWLKSTDKILEMR